MSLLGCAPPKVIGSMTTDGKTLIAVVAVYFGADRNKITHTTAPTIKPATANETADKKICLLFIVPALSLIAPLFAFMAQPTTMIADLSTRFIDL